MDVPEFVFWRQIKGLDWLVSRLRIETEKLRKVDHREGERDEKSYRVSV